MSRGPEHCEQVAFVQMARLVLRSDVLFHAIPNERRSKGEAGRMKAEGALAGAADLIVLWWNGAHCRVVYLEFKSAKGRQSPAQKAFARTAQSAGADYVVVRSVEAAMEALRTLGCPMRQASSNRTLKVVA